MKRKGHLDRPNSPVSSSRGLVVGVFVGVMITALPAIAQRSGPGGPPSPGRDNRPQAGVFVPVGNPAQGAAPTQVEDQTQRNRNARLANGDRKLSPQEKWQLRQLLKANQ
jgi:hypothetical protein